jgi:hypothetical protein
MPKQKATPDSRAACTVLVEVGSIPTDKSKMIPLKVCDRTFKFPQVMAYRRYIKDALGGTSDGLVSGLRLLCEPEESFQGKYPVTKRLIRADEVAV